jgi:hypothetical protein
MGNRTPDSLGETGSYRFTRRTWLRQFYSPRDSWLRRQMLNFGNDWQAVPHVRWFACDCLDSVILSGYSALHWRECCISDDTIDSKALPFDSRRLW